MLSFYWQTFKKILLVVVVFFSVISLFLYFIAKDKPKLTTNISSNEIMKKNREQIYKVINNPELSKTKEGKIELVVYKGMLCGFVGEACTNKPEDASKNYNKSLIGGLANLMVLPLTHPPASGIGWAKDSLANAGFTPKAYAAEGIGFGGIKPFLNLWKVFRDVSYMLLVIVLIAIGFMIMFRMKLNPQTVINIENALPRIVIALLLITFSFAIAGFLIDLMYVLIGVGISIVSNNNAYYDATKFTNAYMTADPWKIIESSFPKTNYPIGGWGGLAFLMQLGNSLLLLVGPTWDQIVRVIGGIIGFYLGAVRFGPGAEMFKELGFTLNQIATGNVVGGIAWIPIFLGVEAISLILGGIGAYLGAFILPQIIVGLLIGLTMIFLMFRIFFMLLRAYLQIILMIILAPVILMMEAVPGRNAFSFWFKNLLSEVLTFPIVVILLVIGYVLINTVSASAGNFWTPPFLSTNAISANAYAVILGMGLVFLIPDLVKIAKEQLFGTKGLPVSIGVGTFFGGATAVGGGAMGTIGQIGSLSLGISALTGKSLGELFKGKKT